MTVLHHFSQRATQARISSTALLQNAHYLQNRAANAKLLPMVKANAYGHGASAVMRILAQANIHQCGVAWVQEASELSTDGFQGRILAMMPPFHEDAEEFLKSDVEFMLADNNILHHFDAVAKQQKNTLRAHLYINTGMQRAGIAPSSALDVMHRTQQYSNINVIGICTHFARADEEDSSFTYQQLSRFHDVLFKLQDNGFTFQEIHTSNSAGILHYPGSQCNLVRPGIALYGYSAPDTDANLKPVLTLHTRIISIRNVQTGESVSYGTKFVAPEPIRVATIPIGYGDGFHRTLTNKAECIIRGKRFPIIGTICMDQCMINLSAHPTLASLLSIGEPVILLGTGGDEKITANDLARQADTIPYEILTSIAPRVTRIYED